MNYKIISDSSSDLFELQDAVYTSVPLKIITDEKEYIDNPDLDLGGMITDLQKYRGASKSSCPNTDEWKQAFESYDNIFCVTITSGLSGSYNAARVALNEYLEENPDKNGLVIDSLSAGPENALIVEKVYELIKANFDVNEIKNSINEYMKKTHLVFALESLKNLANNGRVSSTVAKLSGILGIRVIGQASEQGTLEVIGKARGYRKSVEELIKNIFSKGYNGGKMRIHHCHNIKAADEIAERIKEKFPNAAIKIQETRALCSFYAEAGGLLVGFEGA